MTDPTSRAKSFKAKWYVPNLFLLSVLFGAIVISVLIAPLGDIARSACFQLSIALALYVALSAVPLESAHIDWLWRLVIACAGGIAALAPLGMLSEYHFLVKHLPSVLSGALSGAFNPNVVAGALVVLWPFGLARAIMPYRADIKGWIERIAATVISLLVLVVLCFTASRGGYVGAVVAMLVLAGLLLHRWICWWMVAALLLALVMVMILVADTILPLLLSGNASVDMALRLHIWSRALRIIRDVPLTGVGLGNFPAVVEKVYPLFMVDIPTVSHAHNLYLQVAVDLGLLGLAAFLGLLGLSITRATRMARLASDEPAAQSNTRWLAMACAASLIGMSFHGLIDAAVWGNKGAVFPWVVMGLCNALHRMVFVRRDRGVVSEPV